MRQTVEQLSYAGSAVVRSRQGPSPAYRSTGHRLGFTLVEVVVAMAILFISVFSLIASFSFYGQRLSDVRIATIGQNFTQLLLEDAAGLTNSELAALTSVTPGPVSESYPFNNYPANRNTNSGVYDTGSPLDHLSDAGLDATYVVKPVTTINHNGPPTSLSYTIPAINVPAGMIVLGIESVNGGTNYDFTVTINKDIFPGFKKQIVITDLQPGLTDSAKKSFRVEVTVFWDLRGVWQQYTLSRVR